MQSFNLYNELEILSAYILSTCLIIINGFSLTNWSRNIHYILTWLVRSWIEKSDHIKVYHEVWTVIACPPIEPKAYLFYLLPYLWCEMTYHLSIFAYTLLKIIVFYLLMPCLNCTSFFILLTPIYGCSIQILTIEIVWMLKRVCLVQVLCIILGKGSEMMWNR